MWHPGAPGPPAVRAIEKMGGMVWDPCQHLRQDRFGHYDAVGSMGAIDMRARLQLPQDKLTQFCQSNRIRRLALFGSVLTDRFGPDSDVDVLVEFEPGAVVGCSTWRGWRSSYRRSSVERSISGPPPN